MSARLSHVSLLDGRAPALLAAAVGLASIALSAAPGDAAPPLSWSRPALIDHRPPFPRGAPLSGISCPGTSLCVAVARGGILTSRRPTGGARRWNLATVAKGALLTDISCPTRSLCVAVDRPGDVVTSTRPTAPAAWKVA